MNSANCFAVYGLVCACPHLVGGSALRDRRRGGTDVTAVIVCERFDRDEVWMPMTAVGGDLFSFCCSSGADDSDRIFSRSAAIPKIHEFVALC